MLFADILEFMYFTQKQLRVLNFIRTYLDENALAPTLEEIAESFGLSKVTIHNHIKALEKKGVLRHTPHIARSLEVVDSGQDDKGDKSDKVLWVRGTLSRSGIFDYPRPRRISTELVSVPRGRFDAYRVEDECARESGIRAGDYVVSMKVVSGGAETEKDIKTTNHSALSESDQDESEFLVPTSDGTWTLLKSPLRLPQGSIAGIHYLGPIVAILRLLN